MVGERLEQELLLTEPMVSLRDIHLYMAKAELNRCQVLSSIMKWCWSRLTGGVVTWEAYELFKVGETGREP